MDLVESLHRASRTFGAGIAGTKSRLLAAIAARPDIPRREMRRLGEILPFLCAYPDTPLVLSLARGLARRLPGAVNVHAYSYGVARQMARVLPGRLEIDWPRVEDEELLIDALFLLVTPGESQGVEDIRISLRGWFETSKPRASMTDLEFLLGLLERSPLPPEARAFLFDNARLPLRYRGPQPHPFALPVRRTHFQTRDLDRSSFPLPPIIRRRPGRARRGGQDVIDFCLESLCARRLEIYPLAHANPSDVLRLDCPRGLQVVLIGLKRPWRSTLEALYFFMVFKNGVPVSYGPASALLGCCEMGMNLFPEFRGGEVRFIYAQFMRVLHHMLGVEYFHLTSYAMGEDNDEALSSGAFWFYRKLGFKTTDDGVEKIARAEESRMTANPSHRSDLRMLRKLSHTEAYLDLSGGRRRPLSLGHLGMALSRFIGTHFEGDRALAERRCARRVGRLLGIGTKGEAVRRISPILCMIPDLGRWSRRERTGLRVYLRAKDAPSEARAARLLRDHPRLGAALYRLAGHI